MNPKGTAIRGHATRAAIASRRLGGGTHMIGHVRGSIRVRPVGLFRRHYLFLREVNISRVVLVQARIRGDQILFLHAAVGLLQGVQLRGVMIVVLLTIGLENAPGEVGG